jgi:Zn-dependent protease with chaperone function
VSTNKTHPDVVELVRRYQAQGLWGEPLRRKLERHARTVSGLDPDFARRIVACPSRDLTAVRKKYRAGYPSRGAFLRSFLPAVLALLLLACSSDYIEYAPNGSKSYQTATLCTSQTLAPFVRDAASRWHAAAPRVSMAVRVVGNPEEPQAGCDTNVYEASMSACRAGDGHDAHCLAMGGEGLIVLDPAALNDPELSDILTHEVGHLLLGDAHATDEASVMFWASLPGEQGITAADLSRLP